MYVWHEYRNAIPFERSPSNSDGRAGGGPWPLILGVLMGSGFTGCDVGLGFWRLEIWEIKKSSLSWVFDSFARISARACSRAVSLSLSILGNGLVAGGTVSGITEGESSAGKYTEGSESVLGLQKMPMVYFRELGIGPQGWILF